MWQIRRPREPGDKLWGYVADLRRGDDHDPEEEFRALMPAARLVSEALKGGSRSRSEGLSEARLMEAIARSEERQPSSARRNWAVPAFTAAGWTLASVGFTLSAYQYGLSKGASQVRVAEIPPAPAPVITVEPKPTPPSPKVVAVKKKIAPAPVVAKKAPEKPAVASPPAVRVDELMLKEDALALLPIPSDDPASDSPQNELLREGKSYLTQGRWAEAADLYQRVADENPNDQSALDALHISARIAEVALKDSKRASETYRKEAEMAKLMIGKLGGQNDLPAEPVKIRLARALTSAGLLERNPEMIREATEGTLLDNIGSRNGGE